MTGPFLLIVSLLLSQSSAGGVDPEPRKPNLVTRFLDEILNQIIDQLSTSNVSIPFVDLGDSGNFSKVEGCVSGLKKSLDGVQSHGFKLNLNATRALVWGRYDVEHLDIPGLFPVFGKGPFTVELNVLNLKLTLKAVRDFETQKFVFSLPELKFQVENTKVRFDNLMNDPHLADFLNELLSNLAPSLLTLIVDALKDLLLIPLDYYGNGIFKCLTTEITREKQLECIKNLFQTDTEPLSRLCLDLMGTLFKRAE